MVLQALPRQEDVSTFFLLMLMFFWCGLLWNLCFVISFQQVASVGGLDQLQSASQEKISSVEEADCQQDGKKRSVAEKCVCSSF